MSPEHHSIIESFETLGMTPDEISQSLEIDIVSVKSCLMQFSSKFNNALEKTPELGFSASEQKAALRVISEKMYDEDSRVALKAAMYVRDDAKGRLDAIKADSNNFKVLVFNEDIKKAMAAVNRAKGVVDIEVKTDKALSAA